MLMLPNDLRLKLPNKIDCAQTVQELRDYTIDNFTELLLNWATNEGLDPKLIGSSKLETEARQELLNKFNIEVKICQLLMGEEVVYFSMVVIHYTNKEAAGKILFSIDDIEQLVKVHSSVTIDISSPPVEFAPDLVMLFMHTKPE